MSKTFKPDSLSGKTHRARDRQSATESAKVIPLGEIRRAKQRLDARPLPVQHPTEHAQQKQAVPFPAKFPDLAAIARNPSYAERRRQLAAAMAVFSGKRPSERLLDHQMIATGLAAGHGSVVDGSEDAGIWPLGSGYADPAVVVGLALHHAKQTASRGLPIPQSLLTVLDEHVSSGSAAARLVRDWLNTRSVPQRRQLFVHRGGKP